MRSVLLVLVMVGSAWGEALGALESVLPSLFLDNVEDLVRAASAACELLPLEVLFSRQAGAEAPPMDVVEFRRGGSRRLRAARAARALRHARGTLPLYVPGWWNSPRDEAARALVDALLRHHDAVLVLDTRSAFARPYLSATARVQPVARSLYHLVRNLSEAGIPPSDIHVIGFSLGAHVAGMAGQLVREGLGTPLGRITALDPARPCFTLSEVRLRKSAAAFVEVIHSSAGVLGLEEPAGHADVYVGGTRGRRAGCTRAGPECDHNQAWRVFAAWARAGRLRARRCAAWRDLQRGACATQPALLPFPCGPHHQGMFLYKPDSES